RRSAVLAELPSARLLPAARAHRGALVAVVDLLGPVLLLDLLVQLGDLGGGLHAGDLLVELGGAGDAEPPLLVPADLLAHPLPAPVALLEVGLHLVDGLGQHLVPGRAAGPVPHPFGVPPDLLRLVADGSPQQIAADPREAPSEPGDGVGEAGRVAVAAPLTEELELVPLAGGVVLV